MFAAALVTETVPASGCRATSGSYASAINASPFSFVSPLSYQAYPSTPPQAASFTVFPQQTQAQQQAPPNTGFFNLRQQQAAVGVARCQKLAFLLSSLGSRFAGNSLAVVQVWTSCVPGKWNGVSKQQQNTVVMSTAQQPFSVDDPALEGFRARSCEQGIMGSALGMLGKVWSSGALQVVQNVAIIPRSVHPRNKLDDDVARRVSELVYIPIYDVDVPEAGVVAILEVVVSAAATEAMVVANLISFVSDLLEQLQLSLSKPATKVGAAPRMLMQLPTPTVTSPPSTQEMRPPPPMRPSLSLARTSSMARLPSEDMVMA